jgi:TatD DNase family protein
MVSAKFVDAHIHLTDVEYEGKVDELINDAEKSGVVALVSNSMDYNTSLQGVMLAEKYPTVVHVAVGIHPWNAGKTSEEEIEKTINLILSEKRSPHVIAVGEVGLDYSYEGNSKLRNFQLKVFDSMLKAAEKTSLPIIVHSRGTTREIIELLSSYRIKKVLLHWFSRPLSVLPEIINRGYLITEGPPVVYSQNIREIVRRIPLTSLLTETDGPVRFWGPFKGKMTAPAFIPYVVEAISEIKKLDKEEVAWQILQNFVSFFNLNQSAFMKDSA